MIKTITEITTADTKKTYRWINGKYDGEGEEPELYCIKSTVQGRMTSFTTPLTDIWVERSFMGKHCGYHTDPLLPQLTVEDKIKDLLALLGVQFEN